MNFHSLPQPKTDELASRLWPLFLEDQQLDQVSKLRFKKEIDDLRTSDPDGFIVLSGLLAAINNDKEELLRLSKIALDHSTGCHTMLNWGHMLEHLGLISEAYAFYKKTLKIVPGSSEAISHVVMHSLVFEDTVELEKALQAWYKLNPGIHHPLVLLHSLDQELSALDGDAVGAKLDELSLLTNGIRSSSHVPAERDKKLVRILLDEIDV